MTITDYELDKIAMSYATDILKETINNSGDPYDLAHEYADGSEWAIYYNKAHELCQNCNTDNGEQFFEDTLKPSETLTYNSIASYIAYGELHSRILDKLEKLKDDNTSSQI